MFIFHLPIFGLLSLVLAYIYIIQCKNIIHYRNALACGGMYNNHIIANCLLSVTVKEFWKLVNSRRRYWQK